MINMKLIGFNKGKFSEYHMEDACKAKHRLELQCGLTQL